MGASCKDGMSMERLTNRNKHGGAYYPYCFKENTCDGIGTSEKCNDCDFNTRVCEKLAEYEDIEEQGLILKLPMSIESTVDKLFSHNEIISIWRKVKENGVSCHKRIWYGMAWDIPEKLKNCKFVKIFGIIPESIAHADIINIEVVLSEKAKKALAEMEK